MIRRLVVVVVAIITDTASQVLISVRIHLCIILPVIKPGCTKQPFILSFKNIRKDPNIKAAVFTGSPDSGRVSSLDI